MSRRTLLILSALLLAALPGAAAAQGGAFGKNKIQYEDFDWRILSGEHVDVYFYPEEEELARLTLDHAEETYAALERSFQHHPFRRIPLIVYSSHQHFEQTNVTRGFIPEGVLGFTEYLKRRVALPFRGDYAQFLQTLRHELVHAFQISKLAQVNASLARQPRTTPQQIHWWTEGLAEFWSGEQSAQDAMFIRDLVLNGRLPTIQQFTRVPSFASYPLGGQLHHYLTERFGDEYILRMYEDYWKYSSSEDALEGVLQVDLDQLSRDWHYALEQRFFPVYAERPPFEVGARVVIERGGGNFKPLPFIPAGDSLPNLLFLSPRTGYTNIYRTTFAEGEDGVRTVVEGERSEEFESFHAYESGIDVSYDGVLAFVSRYQERDALFLWDLQRRRVVGRYQWEDLVGLKSPGWSPDGKSIVFEGLTESGYSDLYVLDFDSQELRQLTDDRFRDEDPDWSPDGTTIVFASDRTPFGEEGRRNLFLLDVAGGQVRYLTYGDWNDEAPAWSPDGARIVFTSDRTGIRDLYTFDVSGEGRRLTELAGGAFDPQWLPDGDALVFSGFSEGRFRIYRIAVPPDTADLARIALDRAGAGAALAVAAADSVAGEVATEDSVSVLAGWSWGEGALALADTAESRPYESMNKMSLEFAGGEAVLIQDRASAQGVQFLMSDMLGDHMIYLGVSALQTTDLSNLVDSFSGQLLYLNLSRRLNWGAGVSRFKGRFYDASFNVYDEETYGGSVLVRYPFSKYRRVELRLGLEHSERIDIADACELGIRCATERSDPRDLTRSGLIATNMVSYVKDNTLWLATGPIDGTRFNMTAGLSTCFACERPGLVDSTQAGPAPLFERAPLVDHGTLLEHWLLSGDYRRYFRVTLQSAYAVRLFGFLSDGAIPGRAVLGGPHRLRGYPLFSLAGSRVWLLNQEYRFQLLQGWQLAFPFGNIRFPGIQAAVFADVGSSWLEDQVTEEGWGSYGVGLRTSLGGPLVVRMDVGRRFHMGQLPPVDFGDDEDFGDTFVDFFIGFNY